MQIETGPERTTRWASAWKATERVFMARRGVVALGCVVLASLAFRLHVAHECSFWLDEVLTHLGVLKSWPQVLRGPSRGHPPLMYVLVKVASYVFGTSETGLRSASLIFGCLLLAAMYELCLELGLPLRRALVVIATFALTAFFIRHATEARHYAMLTTFCTLATTRTLRLLRGPRRIRDVVGVALCGVAAAATHYFGLAYALALLGTAAIGVALGWKQSSAYQRFAAISVLLVSLVPLGYLALRAIRIGHSFGVGSVGGTARPAFNSELLREIPHEFSLLTTELGWLLVLQGGLALVGLVLLSRRLRGVACLLPLGLGLAPCAAALFLSAEHGVSARYLAPSAVFYHLGACTTLFAAVDRVRRAPIESVARLAPHFGGLLLVGLLAARLAEYPRGFGAGVDDYRGLRRYFRANLAQDTALVAYPGSFGKLLLDKEYSMGARALSLEKFRPVSGIRRYLIVEIHSDNPERQAEIESLVERKLGLSAEVWRSLPLVPLPHSPYQPAVVARLVQLPPPRPKRKKRDLAPPAEENRPSAEPAIPDDGA